MEPGYASAGAGTGTIPALPSDSAGIIPISLRSRENPSSSAAAHPLSSAVRHGPRGRGAAAVQCAALSVQTSFGWWVALVIVLLMGLLSANLGASVLTRHQIFHRKLHHASCYPACASSPLHIQVALGLGPLGLLVMVVGSGVVGCIGITGSVKIAFLLKLLEFMG